MAGAELSGLGRHFFALESPLKAAIEVVKSVMGTFVQMDLSDEFVFRFYSEESEHEADVLYGGQFV